MGQEDSGEPSKADLARPRHGRPSIPKVATSDELAAKGALQRRLEMKEQFESIIARMDSSPAIRDASLGALMDRIERLEGDAEDKDRRIASLERGNERHERLVKAMLERLDSQNGDLYARQGRQEMLVDKLTDLFEGSDPAIKMLMADLRERLGWEDPDADCDSVPALDH